MLAPLRIPNAYRYSQTGLASPLSLHAYLFTGESGNVLLEPLRPGEPTLRAIDEFGGLALIVVMSEGRNAAARELAARYGCTIVAEPRHRETIAPGMRAIALPNQRRRGEFAVSIPAARAVVCGDALLGTPAGALTLPPETLYGNALEAALSLRRILREYPDAMLTGIGEPVLADAYGALYEALYARAGSELLRINLDQLEFLDERSERAEQPPQFSCLDAEVGFSIGARKLGYRVSTLEPGARFCPLQR
jgi:Metallo-beta-lactamase superfamily